MGFLHLPTREYRDQEHECRPGRNLIYSEEDNV